MRRLASDNVNIRSCCPYASSYAKLSLHETSHLAHHSFVLQLTVVKASYCSDSKRPVGAVWFRVKRTVLKRYFYCVLRKLTCLVFVAHDLSDYARSAFLRGVLEL
jgi:hypothetical protein